MNVVRLKIDGKEVEVPQETTILQAAAAAGIEIPHLCYHPGLSPAGICRLCLVEAGGKLLTACYHLAEEGMEVFTNTERLKNLRRLNLELILSDHPQDCLTCEKNGACELQRYAYEFGLVENRFVGEGHERRKLLPREDNPF
ncbi:MAG: 2Fe-2S iron-sulfur cluster-binding protein, partial [Candidatus Bipolaricaulaceae bacterium]